MKPTDASALQTILDDDLTWRRKEVSAILSLAKSSGHLERIAISRAALPLIYAHWEGYTKNCFIRYFEFVSLKRSAFSKIKINFLYLASKSELRTIGSGSEKSSIEAFENLFERLTKRNADPMRKHVNTKSNLRWDVLCDLYCIAGIENPLSGDETLINRELCDARNEIAHGQSVNADYDKLVKLRDDVFDRLSRIRNSIVFAATDGTYKVAA